jgi:hypothetical protein
MPRPTRGQPIREEHDDPIREDQISAREFDHVRAEPAAEMAERVAAAMAKKKLCRPSDPLREPPTDDSANPAGFTELWPEREVG